MTKQQWKCPKCGFVETPPLAVKEVFHQCKLNIPREYRMELVKGELP